MIDYDPEMGFFDEPSKTETAKPAKTRKRTVNTSSRLLDMIVSSTTAFAVREAHSRDSIRVHRITDKGVSFWERTGLKAASDALVENGYAMPKIVPTGIVTFDPSPKTPKVEQNELGMYVCNTYVPPQWLVNRSDCANTPIDECMQILEANAPTMYNYFKHISSGNMEMAETLLLWVAAQARHDYGRVRTAWLLRGEQGTGKSMLVITIIAELMAMGKPDRSTYCVSKSIQNLQEQYNSWVASNLFVLVDEADIMSMQFSERKELYNRLKSLITNESLTVRAMYKEQEEVRPTAAFIFTSNEVDAFPIEDTDRRFHVMPMAKGNVADALGFKSENQFVAALRAEIPTLALVMEHVALDTEAMRRVDRPAMTAEKEMLVDNTRSIPAQFVNALNKGELGALWDIVSQPLYANPDMANDPTFRSVIAYFALVSRNSGGVVGIPNHIAARMYDLANFGHKAPNLRKMLREQGVMRVSDSGFPKIVVPCYLAELVGYTDKVSQSFRTRGVPMNMPWYSGDNFEELLADKFISDFIAQAIRRESSSGRATVLDMAAAKRNREVSNETASGDANFTA